MTRIVVVIKLKTTRILALLGIWIEGITLKVYLVSDVIVTT